MFTGIAAFLAKPLIKRFGKYFLGAIAIGLLSWFIIGKWNDFKDDLVEQGRKKGVAEATEKFNKQIADNDRRNRKVEEQTEKTVIKFVDRIVKTNNKRKDEEQEISEDINDNIDKLSNNDVCYVSDEIIEDRNRIRALGPQG